MERGPGGPQRGCARDHKWRVSCRKVKARCWPRGQENVWERGKVPGTTSDGLNFLCKEGAHHSGFVYRRSKPIKIPSQHFTPNINVFAFSIMICQL